MFNSFDNNLITLMWNNATAYFSQISPVVLLVLGVLFAFFIIRFLISIFFMAKGYKQNNDDDDDFDDDFDDDNY